MYVRFGQQSSMPLAIDEFPRERPFLRCKKLKPLESYGQDSYEGITLQPIRPKSLATYKRYLRIPEDVCKGPSYKDYNIFKKYADFGSVGA